MVRFRSVSALFVVTLLLVVLPTLRGQPASQEGPVLTVKNMLPLDLGEHLDAAAIIGSELPADLLQPVEWRFDQPQPGWKAPGRAHGQFRRARGDVQLTWVDRTGNRVGTVGTPAGYNGLDLSPDGRRVAIHRNDGDGGDIWIFDNVEDPPGPA